MSKFKDITKEELFNRLQKINDLIEPIKLKVLKDLSSLETYYKQAIEIQDELKLRNEIPSK